LFPKSFAGIREAVFICYHSRAEFNVSNQYYMYSARDPCILLGILENFSEVEELGGLWE
jgi:hypothetical protein